MSSSEFPTSWRDPRFVSTVVGVLAVGGVAFYAALNDGPPTPETAMSVLLAVFIPSWIAYEVARRWL